MSLNASDLYRLELRVRTEAERIRRRWPEEMLSNPTVPPDTKTHARTQREAADDLDQVGNLLVGLQGDWHNLGPMVRAGYMSALRVFDAQSADPLPVEVDAA